jgi:hypothetical protein
MDKGPPTPALLAKKIGLAVLSNAQALEATTTL